MNPKISVIIGVYNTPKNFVKKALDSILNQSYTNFEIIICNDGCTDDTFQYIQKKYGNNNRIVLIENKRNEGLAYTLNHCLEIAKGEYIARMDTDDFSHPNRFEKQVDILDKNHDIGLVNCNIDVFDENGVYGERKYNEVITKKDFLKNNPIVHPAVMFRKSEIKKVNGYRNIKMTIRNEDYDLFMRMFANGTKMYTVQEKLFNFRQDQNTYKRRKFKYRINEAKVRYHGFKLLQLFPKGFIYVLKPILLGMIPVRIISKVKRG